MKVTEIINKLRDDSEYYGDFGRQYISNSDIKNLMYDPAQYGAVQDNNLNFEKGRYFHQLILEPNKAKEFPICNYKGRNTKAYKEFLLENNLEFALTSQEAVDIKDMVDYLLNKSPTISDLITNIDAEYEVPQIGKIFGRMFKGKADIISNQLIIDLKSTSDIHKFKKSAYLYNYDSQAFIYQTIFGLPITFIVVGKERKYFGKSKTPYFDIGVFPTSEEFIMSGKQKVEIAMQNYEKFFGPDSTDSIEELIINTPL